MSIIREYGVYMYIYVHIYTHIHMGFPGGSDCKEFNYSVEDLGSVPGWEDPLEEGMATHSSILAWRISTDRRNLVGYSPCGHKERDRTEQSAECSTQGRV